MLGEIEQLTGSDPEDEGDQPSRQLRREAFGSEQQRKRRSADCERQAARVSEMSEKLDELPDRVAAALLDPEQLGQLADRDEDCETEHEPLHHRLREELGDESHPEKAGEQEEQAADQNEPGGKGRILGRALRPAVRDP